MPWFGNSRWSIPEEHSGEVIGAIAGGIFGLLVIVAGFWRALAFGVFVVAGFVLGRCRRSRQPQGRDCQAVRGRDTRAVRSVRQEWLAHAR